MNYKVLSNELEGWFQQNVQVDPQNFVPMESIYARYASDSKREFLGHGKIKRKTFATLFKKAYQCEIEGRSIKIYYADKSTVMGIRIREDKTGK